MIIGALPLLAGTLLYAQAETPNPQMAVTNSGPSYSSSCFFQRTQKQRLQNGDLNVSVVTATNCPVEQTNSAIGVVAPNGAFVPLAAPTSTPLITTVRKHSRLTTMIAANQPVNVHVFFLPDGSAVVRPNQ